ncbi:RNA-directed DNA polymerase (Reverse transcriptase) [Turneriella parva DSM 21527]|uniref:RNA-directed DNA polymerase (Reverse transcriptase) n=2 Tax=Turneriella TaxID=338321 RepID=I4B0C5_TURPD|nr:RNA-directed DNA polymerase (Reverse transcriptase) [Turneriella parva DSM 21527]
MTTDINTLNHQNTLGDKRRNNPTDRREREQPQAPARSDTSPTNSTPLTEKGYKDVAGAQLVDSLNPRSEPSGTPESKQSQPGGRKPPLMCHPAITYDAMCSLAGLQRAQISLIEELKRRGEGSKHALSYEDLTELGALLRSHQYSHRPCRLMTIKVGSKKRDIDSPDWLDRIVQRTYVDTIYPLVQQMACDSSHAYLYKRSIHTALWRLIMNIEHFGYSHVFRTDIESFFDSIPHAEMERVIDLHIRDIELNAFSHELLRVAEGFKNSKVGLPTGWLIPPLWANMLLTPVDARLESAGLKFFRYGDDYGILQRSKQEAEFAQGLLESALKPLGLHLKPGYSHKTYTRKLEDGLIVLGHEIRRINNRLTVAISKNSLAETRRELHGKICSLRYAEDAGRIAGEIWHIAHGWSGNAVHYGTGFNHPRFAQLADANTDLLTAINSLPPQRKALLLDSPMGKRFDGQRLLIIRPLVDMPLIKEVAA